MQPVSDVGVAAATRLARVRGVIRGRGGSGPVLVSAEIRQGDETVVPRRTFAAPFELECEDGTRVRVEPGEWPRLSPTSRDRGSWDELQAHPLAAPFTDFAPGPHESFELSGEALADGDEVEAVGDLVAPDLLRPRMVAAGRKARAEIDEFLARLAPAAQPSPEATVRGTWRSRGHFFPLAFAVAGGLAWLLGDPSVAQAGVLVACVFLAIAAYHQRMIRPLTRFRRVAPSREPHFPVAGTLERGLDTGLAASGRRGAARRSHSRACGPRRSRCGRRSQDHKRRPPAGPSRRSAGTRRTTARTAGWRRRPRRRRARSAARRPSGSRTCSRCRARTTDRRRPAAHRHRQDRWTTRSCGSTTGRRRWSPASR